jgi:hypothetical protein
MINMKQETAINWIVASTMVITLAIVLVEAANDQANAQIFTDRRHLLLTADAPIATSGDNIYITWWTNKTGNNEVMFRASTDNGRTFEDKINLSNSTEAESVDAQIGSSGNRVFVTWWERNQTDNVPVLRISTNNGATFGPILKLGANGTIGEGG